MRMRKRMTKSKSKRDFRKKSGIHPKNKMQKPIMRGGIRL